jgi:gluconolactonase
MMNFRTMDRILPFALVAVSGAWVYACSSSNSDESDPNPTDPTTTGAEAGTDSGTHNNNAGDTGTSTTVAQNPIEGVKTATAVTEADFNGMYIDGLIWADGSLYYSSPGASIFRYTPGLDNPTSIYVPAGISPLGITYDATRNQLLFASAPDDNITRGSLDRVPTGTMTGVTPVSGIPNPPPWWSPNDVVVAQDGTIYVTDPLYQVDGKDEHNAVYSVAPTTGAVTPIDDFGGDLVRPNGIGLSRDGSILYVSLTISDPDNPNPPSVVKYAIDANGNAGPRTPFVQFDDVTAAPDGLGVDTDGNVHVATSTGVRVYKPDGSSWGTIGLDTPGVSATNVAFGGSDFKTLYISTDAKNQGPGLFSVTVKVAGLQQ